MEDSCSLSGCVELLTNFFHVKLLVELWWLCSLIFVNVLISHISKVGKMLKIVDIVH